MTELDQEQRARINRVTAYAGSPPSPFRSNPNRCSIRRNYGLIIAAVYMKNAAFGFMPKKAFFIASSEHVISFAALGALHGCWS